MKNIVTLFLMAGLLLHASCKKDCCTKSDSSCGTQKLKVCDATAVELRKRVIRNDSLAQIGVSTAIKSVPDKGEIEWVANNVFHKEEGNKRCYLDFTNYSDTLWRDLEWWAYLRDDLFIISDYYTLGRHEISSEDDFKLDSTKNYAKYFFLNDDTVIDVWQINPKLENYVIINSIDESKKVIEGEFNLHFIKDGTRISATGLDYSNEINFRCGTFKAKIVE